ncbi:hypothetical protein F3Y22_tig00110247pilonHSYRG00051 [Hibiscus syriacus]|uniref:Uncharacterized protein n=1 Tax=Hibiscus syriacus TaxID=106335 RepID=A0A6A3B5X6_HIBSY|nr:hypothetical protein F3Y22_tig00110247pilonHSYRG00051 [Hibiscus syriacus]
MRKPCRLLAGQGEDDLKIDAANEMSKLDATGLGKSVNLTNLCLETIYLIDILVILDALSGFICLRLKKRKTWHCLRCRSHLSIPRKNGDLAVSFVNEYLARKLNLEHESEVEVVFRLSVGPGLNTKRPDRDMARLHIMCETRAGERQEPRRQKLFDGINV